MGRRRRDSCERRNSCERRKRIGKYWKLLTDKLSARRVDTRYVDAKCLTTCQADVKDLKVERVEADEIKLQGQTLDVLFQPLGNTVRKESSQSETEFPITSQCAAEFNSYIYYTVNAFSDAVSVPVPTQPIQSINFSNIALKNVENLVCVNVQSYVYAQIVYNGNVVHLFYNPKTNQFVANPNQYDDFLLQNTLEEYQPVASRSVNIQPQTQLFTNLERHNFVLFATFLREQSEVGQITINQNLSVVVDINVGTDSNFLPVTQALKSTPVYASLAPYNFAWKVDKTGDAVYAGTAFCAFGIFVNPSSTPDILGFITVSGPDGRIYFNSQNKFLTNEKTACFVPNVGLEDSGATVCLAYVQLLNDPNTFEFGLLFTGEETGTYYTYGTDGEFGEVWVIADQLNPNYVGQLFIIDPNF